MQPPERPAPATYEGLAKIINLPLLLPEWTATQVHEGLESAKRYGLGCATVRPCDIDLAVRTLEGSAVRAGAAAGFPHGWASTAVKLYEIRDLLRRGAREIAMAVAVPKLVSREFPYIQTELLQASEACHKEGAALTVVLESAYLTDEMKIVACRCAERAEADTVAVYGGTIDDVRLVRKQLPEETGVEAGGEIDSVDRLLEMYAAGATRFATSAVAKLLDEWKGRRAGSTEPAAGTQQE
jgi:deoxyribose-phosphate aldolase